MRATISSTSEPIAALSVPAGPSAGEDYATRRFILHDPVGTAVVYFENAADGEATTTSGFEWRFDTPLTLSMEPGEAMNARVAAVPVELHVLRVGR